MMRDKVVVENHVQGGVGFIGLLQILFIGLKLTHYIDWGWMWVLSPTIVGVVVWFVVLAVALFLIFMTGRL